MTSTLSASMMCLRTDADGDARDQRFICCVGRYDGAVVDLPDVVTGKEAAVIPDQPIFTDRNACDLALAANEAPARNADGNEAVERKKTMPT